MTTRNFYGERGLRHSQRFRKIGGDRYPRRVAEAYDGDLSRAAADSDEQVAATIAAWESWQGLTPRDWSVVGARRDSA